MGKLVKFNASGFDPKEMRELVSIIQAKGLNVECEFSTSGKTAEVTFRDLPTVREIERAKGGRHKKRLAIPKESQFSNDTLCKDFLNWLDCGHTSDEAIAELGIPRATYFRRLKVWRAIVEWEDDRAADREATGRKAYFHTLSSTGI